MAIKGDVYMSTTKVVGKEGDAGFDEVSASASRVRLATDVAGGKKMHYFIELGARMDGGDGATGLGVDFAYELGLADFGGRADGKLAYRRGAVSLSRRISEVELGIKCFQRPWGIRTWNQHFA